MNLNPHIYGILHVIASGFCSPVRMPRNNCNSFGPPQRNQPNTGRKNKNRRGKKKTP